MPRIRTLYFCIILAVTALSQAWAQIPAHDRPTRELASWSIRSFEVYPNPAVEEVRIKNAEFNANHVQVAVHNLIGNEMRVEVEVISENEIRVKLKDLDSGYYLISLIDQHQQRRTTLKILKRG